MNISKISNLGVSLLHPFQLTEAITIFCDFDYLPMISINNYMKWDSMECTEGWKHMKDPGQDAEDMWFGVIEIQSTHTNTFVQTQ